MIQCRAYISTEKEEKQLKNAIRTGKLVSWADSIYVHRATALGRKPTNLRIPSSSQSPVKLPEENIHVFNYP